MSTIDNRLTSFNTTATRPAASAQTASAQQPNGGARQTGGASGSADITLNTVSGTSQTAAATGEDGLTPAYTVEISEEGAALSAADGSAAAGSARATDPNTTTAASSGTTNTAATTSETNTSNLSIYSDYQLQKLLSNGEISRNEYAGEVAKRDGRQAKEGTGSASALSVR